jgi:hypothetical protein
MSFDHANRTGRKLSSDPNRNRLPMPKQMKHAKPTEGDQASVCMKPVKRRRRTNATVHIAEPSTTTSTTPKGKNNRRQRLRRDDGRPNPNSKLTNASEEKLCGLVQNQLTLTDACDVLEINRTTVWEWRSLGQRDPDSRYGQFERAITKADALAKSSLIRAIARHPDLKGKIFLLKNRYPAEYRDRVYQEIAGPAGAPIPVAANPFQVNIVMSGDPEPKFTIVDHSARGNGHAGNGL